MQKYGGAVIHMMSKIDYLVGNAQLIENIKLTPSLDIFDDHIIDFLSDLSREILASKIAKLYPDVITFGFWIRKASILDMKNKYVTDNKKIRVGRGLSFHIAPSNVPVNFAYSMVASLLAGNSNIIRLSSKEFVEADIICNIINEVLNSHKNLREYIIICRYAHDNNITDYLSRLCDNRIIWGGNETIKKIRLSPIGYRCKDISFPNRYSICIIDSNGFLLSEDKDKICYNFYNDTFLNDQNACTSPKVMIWIGENIDEASNLFWNSFDKYVREKYIIKDIQNINKLTTEYKFVCGVGNEYNAENHFKSEYLTVINISKIDHRLMTETCSGGYFYNFRIEDLSEILPICTLDLQTISVIEFDKRRVKEFIQKYKPRGIDRVVSVGHTLDFDFAWDGYDLIFDLSRIINIA